MKPKILCLETEVFLQDMIVRVFETRYGFDVTRDSTLAEAGKKLVEHSFDLLTMSILFPVHDGDEHPHGYAGLTFLRELRGGAHGEQAAKMPVLIISGAKNLGKIVEDSLPSLENTWSLEKPFSYFKLNSMVHEALGLPPSTGT